LCDDEKGGDTTTAIALQKTSSGITYWIASNTNLKRKRRKEFLEDVLRTLSTSTPSNRFQIESYVYEKAVEHSAKRISDYARRLKVDVVYLLGHRDWIISEEDVSLVNWLQVLAETLNHSPRLCFLCYEIRFSEEYRMLRLHSEVGSYAAGRFDTIRHTVGRLNHTMKATKIIVMASLELPCLFKDFEVENVPSPPVSPPPLLERDPALVAVAGRMLDNPDDIEKYRCDLEAMDHKYQLSNNLHVHCQDETWKPKVHAELILLHIFWSEKYAFVGGDKYIACSKAACYCCHHYINMHPGKFVLPASHRNSFLRWRVPDVLESDEKAIIVQRDILNKMIKTIRTEILEQIMLRKSPNPWRPDSATEISTVLRDLALSPSSSFDAVTASPEEVIEASFHDSSDCNSMIADGRNSDSESDEEDGGVSLCSPSMF